MPRTSDPGSKFTDRYRKLKVKMWGDEKFRALTSPKPCGQFLWIHLLSGPHTTAIPGLSSIGEAALAEQLQWPLREFRRCWREVEGQALAQADWQARVVFLPNGIAHNEPESPSVVKGWVMQHLPLIPECDLKREAIYRIGMHLQKMGPAWEAAWVPGWETAWSPGYASSGAGAGAGAGAGSTPPPPSPDPQGSLPGNQTPPETPDRLMELWNAAVPKSRRNGLPGLVLCRGLTETRRRKGALRLKDAELAWHEKVIERLVNSTFASGGGKPTTEHPKPFRASFDWYVENDTNCMKAAEGRYDDATPLGPQYPRL